MAVLGKLLGSRFRVGDSFLHHARLHGFERNIVVVDEVFVVVCNDGDALFKQLTLTGNNASHQVYFVRSNRDDERCIIAIFSFV